MLTDANNFQSLCATNSGVNMQTDLDNEKSTGDKMSYNAQAYLKGLCDDGDISVKAFKELNEHFGTILTILGDNHDEDVSEKIKLKFSLKQIEHSIKNNPEPVASVVNILNESLYLM